MRRGTTAAIVVAAALTAGVVTAAAVPSTTSGTGGRYGAWGQTPRAQTWDRYPTDAVGSRPTMMGGAGRSTPARTPGGASATAVGVPGAR